MIRKVMSIVFAVFVLICLMMTPVFGNKPVVIVSGSMEPTIKTNALTVVHFCKTSSVKVGDIVTYYHPILDELITHRVIRIDEHGMLWTRGDANNLEDGFPITDKYLYGKQILIMNWTVPIMERLIADNSYDRTEAVANVLMAALILSILLSAFRVWTAYLSAIWFVHKSAVYSEEDCSKLRAHINNLTAASSEIPSLSWWTRVRFHVLYSQCEKQLKDMSDELKQFKK